jgi:hypothetical protein
MAEAIATLIEAVGEPDDYVFPRGPCKIVCQIVEGGSYLFERYDPATKTRHYLDLEFWETGATDGDAEIVSYEGMLTDAIAPMLDGPYTLEGKTYEDFWRVGWFCIEGFTAHYSRDYWGDCDVDYECTDVRIARWSDYAETIARPPWWARILLIVGIDLAIPARWGHPK